MTILGDVSSMSLWVCEFNSVVPSRANFTHGPLVVFALTKSLCSDILDSVWFACCELMLGFMVRYIA